MFRTYEAGILEALDDLWREGRGDLAVVVANGGGRVKGYLGHVRVGSWCARPAMWDSVVRTESGSVVVDGEVDSVSLPHADLMTGRRLAKEGLDLPIFPLQPLSAQTRSDVWRHSPGSAGVYTVMCTNTLVRRHVLAFPGFRLSVNHSR